MASLQKRLIRESQKLLSDYPWASKPLLVGAPMRIFSGAELASAVSSAGGFGFVGPTAKPSDVHAVLDQARNLISEDVRRKDTRGLPIGVGFQTWDADIDVAVGAIGKYCPRAAWLFAPRNGQAEFDTWAQRIRRASPNTQVWIQCGTLLEAVDAAQAAEKARPDVLVVQGTDAGGHGRATDGIGITTLLPEIRDAVDKAGAFELPIIAAGGIADGRGVAGALVLGAGGVAMGTRFLASPEANISKGYQDAIIDAKDGAHSTVRTTLYNQLRGTKGWPEEFAPRTIINQSWVDHQAGVNFDQLKSLHDEALKLGDEGWGTSGRLATYAGAGVGLINEVQSARDIIQDVKEQMLQIIRSINACYA
jgi:nitronate monooxygenase